MKEFSCDDFFGNAFGQKCPSLIIHGSEDWVILCNAAFELYKLLHDCEILIIPYKGHSVAYEETSIIKKK